MLEKLIDVLQMLIKALQENTAAHSGNATAVDTAPPEKPEKPTPPSKPARTPPPAKPKPPAKPATPPNFAAEEEVENAKPMTRDEANAALIEEWQRLAADHGEDAATLKINDVFAEYGVVGLTKLPAGSYGEFVAKVQSLK